MLQGLATIWGNNNIAGELQGVLDAHVSVVHCV